jgi:hypothetical protein
MQVSERDDPEQALKKQVAVTLICVENSSKRALKSSTRTPGSEDKKTPGGLRQMRRDWLSRRRRTKPWVSDKSTLTSLE